MAVLVNMPKTGLNMEEGTILRFLVNVGDKVEAEQPLAEIETDKNTTEITAPEAGIVIALLCKEGDTVPILAPVMALGAEGEIYEGAVPEKAGEGNPPAGDRENSAPAAGAPAPAADASAPKEASLPALPGGRIKASPLAKRIAREEKLDLSALQGSGPNGEILRKDVMKALEARKTAAPGRTEAPGAEAFAPAIKAPAPWELPVKERIPLTGMRKAIARNMSLSKAVAPHFALSTDIDMTEAMALREKLKGEADLKVSYNDILTLAVCRALEKNPGVNCAVGETEIVVYDTINVGIAVSVEKGLVVPVIAGADKMSLSRIAARDKELIEAARAGKIPPDAVNCGTITISNLGMYEVDHFQAIINVPEACILAVGKIAEKPVSRNGEIVSRPIMNVTASFDHRAIDGALGARFLTDLKKVMENPVLALI